MLPTNYLLTNVVYTASIFSVNFVSVYFIFDRTNSSCELFDFPQVLSASTGAIFGGANNEMTNTMKSHIHSYNELEEELVGLKFMEENNFPEVKGRIGANVAAIFKVIF